MREAPNSHRARDIGAAKIMVCRQDGEYDFVKVFDCGLMKRVSKYAEQAIPPELDELEGGHAPTPFPRGRFP